MAEPVTEARKVVYIYALCNPGQPWSVRYIGKTSKDPKVRLREHLKPYALREVTHKNHWIKSLKDKGQKPEILLLDQGTEESWRDLERFYIKSHRDAGFNLTNTTDGGVGWSGRTHSPDARKKIAEARSRQTFGPETRAKWSKIHKGNQHAKGAKHTAEMCAEKSRRLLGRQISLDARKGMATKLRPNNTSGCPGVSFRKGRNLWVAQIVINKKTHYIGGFHTKEEAITARLGVVRNLYGEES